MERTEQDMIENKRAENTGLYDPSFEHDNCGIGAVVNIKGIKTHDTVNNALKIVENLEHRAGKDLIHIMQKPQSTGHVSL